MTPSTTPILLKNRLFLVINISDIAFIYKPIFTLLISNNPHHGWSICLIFEGSCDYEGHILTTFWSCACSLQQLHHWPDNSWHHHWEQSLPVFQSHSPWHSCSAHLPHPPPQHRTPPGPSTRWQQEGVAPTTVWRCPRSPLALCSPQREKPPQWRQEKARWGLCNKYTNIHTRKLAVTW